MRCMNNIRTHIILQKVIVGIFLDSSCQHFSIVKRSYISGATLFFIGTVKVLIMNWHPCLVVAASSNVAIAQCLTSSTWRAAHACREKRISTEIVAVVDAVQLAVVRFDVGTDVVVELSEFKSVAGWQGFGNESLSSDFTWIKLTCDALSFWIKLTCGALSFWIKLTCGGAELSGDGIYEGAGQ